MRCHAVALAMMFGCGTEANVGTVPCGPRGACQKLGIQSPVTFSDVSTKTTARWNARWTKREELGLTNTSQGGMLANASDGGLWLIRLDGADVLALRLDPDGNIVGQVRIPPPPGTQLVASTPLGGNAGAADHAQGPVLSFAWSKPCSTPGWTGATCGTVEYIVLGNDANTAPVRIPSKVDRSGSGLFDGAVRSARGDTLYVPYVKTTSISEIDFLGNELWRHGLPRSLDNTALSSFASPLMRVEAMDTDGSLLITLNGRLADDQNKPILGVLLRQPTDGKPLEALQYDLPDWSPATGQFEFDGSHPSQIAVDPRGRRTLIHNTTEGDIVILRIQGDQGEGFRLLRQDYRDLAAGALGTAPSGKLYLSTLAGGRSPDDDTYGLLCEVPMDGAARCLRAVDEAYDIQVPAEGALYTLGLAGLTRYDL